MTRNVILTLCLLSALVGTGTATVPTSVSVQGKLTDSLGTPLPPGSRLFVFSIHDAAVGGTKLWPTVGLEYQTLTTDPSGLWMANVGALVPLTDPVFTDSVRWLEVAVDDNGPVVLPRIRMVTGPYAHRVSTVDGASGGTITSQVAIGPSHSNTGLHGFAVGSDNNVRGEYASVTGGRDNIAFSDSTHVGGGGGNTAYGLRATVGGGANNETGGDQATVAGGRFNKAEGLSSTVGGGYANVAAGVDASVGGGSFDSASGNFATVAGGTANKASGHYSTVGGGAVNRTAGGSSTVAGGYQNSASGDDATVGGGFNNEAAGYRATVPGGTNNAANGANSFACGVNAWATHDRSFVWNDNPAVGLQSSAPDHFVIGASGRVGVGTNAPEGYLHVFDGSAGSLTASPNSIAVFERDSAGYISVLTPANTERGILFGQPGSVADGGIVYAATDPRAMQFRTVGNTTRMVLDHEAGGMVGARLAVVSAVGTSSQLNLRHSTGTANASISFDEPGSSNNLLFSVLNSIRMRIGAADMDITGQVNVAGAVCATNVTCPSDSSLKCDIRPLTGALATVAELRGVEYRWKDEVASERNWSDQKQIGLLAQEVEKLVPQAVIEQSDGYLAVDYSRLVPLLIEAIKEQQRQIDELTTRLDVDRR